MGNEAAESEDRESKNPVTVIVAMLANLTIAAAKFVVAMVSGSAAMFAEGVHSVVDTLNQSILLYGARRSRRVADDTHPFGYGKEIYFWALIYSVLLFGIGGGVSVYKGVTALLNPELPGEFLWTYVVLGVAFVAEGSSWLVARNAVVKESKASGLVYGFRRTTDPTRFAIIGEDSAAMLGVAVALVGILLTQVLGHSYPDAIASIGIGLILCGTAVLLTGKTKELLVGQAAAPDVVHAVHKLLQQHSDVLEVGTPLTMHLGPGQMLAAIDIKFAQGLSAVAVARAVDQMESSIRSRYPQFTRIYIEAQLGRDDIEQEQPARDMA